MPFWIWLQIRKDTGIQLSLLALTKYYTNILFENFGNWKLSKGKEKFNVQRIKSGNVDTEGVNFMIIIYFLFRYQYFQNFVEFRLSLLDFWTL
jgi:hypothetical protein